MRCKFCGWENPENKVVCEKCNQPLEHKNINTGGDIYDYKPADGGMSKDSNMGFEPKATVRETDLKREQPTQRMGVKCSNCGYVSNESTEYCPNCGAPTSVNLKPLNMENIDVKKTVRPDHGARFHKDNHKQFNLSVLSNVGDKLSTLNFRGNHVVLNRENTEKNNSTITSGQQATISCNNGVWTIEDNSELKTTYVQVSHPVELHSGDLILLGDRLFRFDLVED